MPADEISDFSCIITSALFFCVFVLALLNRRR